MHCVTDSKLALKVESNQSILICREAALCPYPLILACVVPMSVLSFQPNYSVLRIFPDLKFVFDVGTGELHGPKINQTDVPTVMFKGKVIMGQS